MEMMVEMVSQVQEGHQVAQEPEAHQEYPACLVKKDTRATEGCQEPKVNRARQETKDLRVKLDQWDPRVQWDLEELKEKQVKMESQARLVCVVLMVYLVHQAHKGLLVHLAHQDSQEYQEPKEIEDSQVLKVLRDYKDREEPMVYQVSLERQELQANLDWMVKMDLKVLVESQVQPDCLDFQVPEVWLVWPEIQDLKE